MFFNHIASAETMLAPCPDTSKRKAKYFVNIKRKKVKTIKCRKIAKKRKRLRLCTKLLANQDGDVFAKRVQDVCIQQCASKTGVCEA